MGEPRAKGIRELRLGFADGGMRCNICRSENISVGVAIAKRVKSSLEYVFSSSWRKLCRVSPHLAQNIHVNGIVFEIDCIVCRGCSILQDAICSDFNQTLPAEANRNGDKSCEKPAGEERQGPKESYF